MNEHKLHVLVIGAGGFIGSHIADGLLTEGYQVTRAGRASARLTSTWPEASTLACDISRDDLTDWGPRLVNVDAVVNCAGLIGNDVDYVGVHDRGARTLFDACYSAGVGRVIQVSALGADDTANSAYHLSKRRADDYLAALDPTGKRMGWAILRPSLVLGCGGASMELFTTLAALPIVPRLGDGNWQVQPIHIDDVVEAVVRLLRLSNPLALKLDAVGPLPMTTDELTEMLRCWLGLGVAPLIRLPRLLLAIVARIGVGPATQESLAMLAAGNTASPEPFAEALGFSPMTMGEAFARHPATPGNLVVARIQAISPVLSVLLALVWLAGGIVSLIFAPSSLVASWLARVGLAGVPAAATLWAGSLADIAIGVALLARVRGAAMAGVALMLAYTTILTIAAPTVWADPFGPLVKNLAVLGLSLAVFALEPRRG